MIFIRDSPRMAQSQLSLPVRIALEDQRLRRSRRAVNSAVRSPVRPATRWRRVVSRASARGIAGRRVVSRRASIDVPASGGPGGGGYGQNARAPCSFASHSPAVCREDA